MTICPRTQLRAFPALTLAALAACSPGASDPARASPQQVAVEVQPATADLGASGAVQFAAAVTGTADTTVVWDVVEAGGGTVGANGVYTAPAAGGTFHVRATSHADPASQATAAVTVAPPAPPTIVVTLSPRTPTVAASGTVAFTASVTGTTNTAVAWSVQEASGCGSITNAGIYTAPAAAATCHVVATSSADATSRDTATITVTAPPPPVTVAISPASGATNSCKSLTFTATVANATDTSVDWSVQEGAAGGTITTAGVYAAPANAGTYHVVAASHAAPTKTAVATVVVTDKVLSVAVTPATTSVTAGGTQQFTATVTTTCGSFTSTASVAQTGALVAN